MEVEVVGTPEQNKETVRRFIEGFNDRDRASQTECCTETCVEHTSRGADRTLDPEIHWQDCLAFYQRFPDVRATIHNMIAEGDRVFLRQTLTGTHEGKTEGSSFEPTGKKATWAMWCEYRLEGGRIAEVWCLSDSLHLYEQLGVVESPARKPAGESATGS